MKHEEAKIKKLLKDVWHPSTKTNEEEEKNMKHEEALVEAAKVFCQAQISGKNPSKEYRCRIEELLKNAWRKSNKYEEVTINGSYLYTLLGQAVQLLPGEDD